MTASTVGVSHVRVCASTKRAGAVGPLSPKRQKRVFSPGIWKKLSPLTVSA